MRLAAEHVADGAEHREDTRQQENPSELPKEDTQELKARVRHRGRLLVHDLIEAACCTNKGPHHEKKSRDKDESLPPKAFVQTQAPSTSPAPHFHRRIAPMRLAAEHVADGAEHREDTRQQENPSELPKKDTQELKARVPHHGRLLVHDLIEAACYTNKGPHHEKKSRDKDESLPPKAFVQTQAPSTSPAPHFHRRIAPMRLAAEHVADGAEHREDTRQQENPSELPKKDTQELKARVPHHGRLFVHDLLEAACCTNKGPHHEKKSRDKDESLPPKAFVQTQAPSTSPAPHFHRRIAPMRLAAEHVADGAEHREDTRQQENPSELPKKDTQELKARVPTPWPPVRS